MNRSAAYYEGISEPWHEQEAKVRAFIGEHGSLAKAFWESRRSGMTAEAGAAQVVFDPVEQLIDCLMWRYAPPVMWRVARQELSRHGLSDAAVDDRMQDHPRWREFGGRDEFLLRYEARLAGPRRTRVFLPINGIPFGTEPRKIAAQVHEIESCIKHAVLLFDEVMLENDWRLFVPADVPLDERQARATNLLDSAFWGGQAAEYLETHADLLLPVQKRLAALAGPPRRTQGDHANPLFASHACIRLPSRLPFLEHCYIDRDSGPWSGVTLDAIETNFEGAREFWEQFAGEGEHATAAYLREYSIGLEEDVGKDIGAPLLYGTGIAAKDRNVPELSEEAVQEMALTRLLRVHVPDLQNLPVDTVIEARGEAGWNDLRRMVRRIAQAVREEGLEAAEARIDDALLKELSDQYNRKKVTFGEAILQTAVNLVSLIPLASYATAIFGTSTVWGAYKEGQEDWHALLARIQKKAV